MGWDVGYGSYDTRSIIIQLKYTLDTPLPPFCVFPGKLRYFLLSAKFNL